MDIAAKREKACTKLLAKAHEIIAEEGATPTALHQLKKKLIALAARTELFPDSDFARPKGHGILHPLMVEDNDGFGLYLTIGLPGKEAAPHSHGIWCVNAGIAGEEQQVFWRRAENGALPDDPTLVKVAESVVRPGSGVAMASHDIHSNMVIGKEPAIALALYGYAVARFPSVVWFNPDLGAVRATPSRRPRAA